MSPSVVDSFQASRAVVLRNEQTAWPCLPLQAGEKDHCVYEQLRTSTLRVCWGLLGFDFDFAFCFIWFGLFFFLFIPRSKWLETSQSYSSVRQNFSDLNIPLNYPH